MIEVVNKPDIQIKVRKVGLQGECQCRTRTDLTSCNCYGPAGQDNVSSGHNLQRMMMYLKVKVCQGRVLSQMGHSDGRVWGGGAWRTEESPTWSSLTQCRRVWGSRSSEGCVLS